MAKAAAGAFDAETRAEGEADEAPPRMIRCTVAPGHTVITGLPPWRGHGTGVERPRIRTGTQASNGPGSIIELPEDEYLHNLERGFVLDPDGRERVPNGLGPIFDRDTTASPGGAGGQNTMITTAGR